MKKQRDKSLSSFRYGSWRRLSAWWNNAAVSPPAVRWQLVHITPYSWHPEGSSSCIMLTLGFWAAAMCCLVQHLLLFLVKVTNYWSQGSGIQIYLLLHTQTLKWYKGTYARLLWHKQDWWQSNLKAKQYLFHASCCNAYICNLCFNISVMT